MKKIYFLNCLFDKIKNRLINIFSLPKNNLKEISFYHLLDISLCQKVNLKETTFNHLLIFCAIWELINK